MYRDYKGKQIMSMGLTGRHPGGFRLQGTLPKRQARYTARGDNDEDDQAGDRTERDSVQGEVRVHGRLLCVVGGGGR